MCHRQNCSLVRTDCILLVFSSFLLVYGSCQNAGPGGLLMGSEMKENEHRRDDFYDVGTSNQQFKKSASNSLSTYKRMKWQKSMLHKTAHCVILAFEPDRWVGSEQDEGSFDEPVTPGSSTLADTDVETKTEMPWSNGNNNTKAEMSELGDGDYVEFTRQSSLAPLFSCNSARGLKRRLCINESRLKNRRRYMSGGRREISNTRSSVSNTIRGSSSRNRRLQNRRQTRAKNRGRKKSGKRIKERKNGGKIRSRKNKTGENSAKAPSALHRASNENIRNSNGTLEGCSFKDCPLNDTVVSTGKKSEARDNDFYVGKDVDSDNTVLPRFTENPAQLYRRHEDNVEHEFSKNLEKEILWSRIVHPRIQHQTFSNDGDGGGKSSNSYRDQPKTENLELDAGETVMNTRYDAAKMLGYSRAAEDLPIMDLENEVLARTLKDYNEYLKTGGKSSKLVRHANEWSDEARNSQDQPRNVPIPVRPSYDHDSDKNNGQMNKQQHQEIEKLADSDATTTLKGDLTCIKGTFLPAPLSRHALIKYVKSSVPGHEYLEADYECTPGYYMASSNSRLLCKDHQWVGELPNCKIRHGQSGSCGESSCDQVCNEVDGEAKCSCYKGFRLNGHKCIDINECEKGNGGCEHTCINTPGSYRCECPQGMKQGEDKFGCMDVNECLLNNGHGPCQDTCQNLERGYACSCEGLPGTTLSPNNHTCQDAGPCSVNNAGCSHTCLSTMGRVFCLCPDGFILDDDWKTCQDVDECSVPDLQTEDICHYGCINTPGSYRCIDPTGELSDEPIRNSTCLPGYEFSSVSNCVDINECAINNGECREVCENTEGSFFCACDGDEKVLSADGRSCTDINNLACPPLDPARREYLICSRETTSRQWRDIGRAANQPGTKCYLKCPAGYQLHGEYELTCQENGTWDGPKHGECVKDSRPRIECPKDVVAEIPLGRDEAFVTFDQPSTDLDWFRDVRSEPSWGKRLEANLSPGLHLVTFFARHPVTRRNASCVLRIMVKDINKLACPPLDHARRGDVICSSETTPRQWRDIRGATNQPGTKCYLKCHRKYQLHGEYELTCQEDGTWDGPNNGECVRCGRPRLECPKDVVAEVPPDRDEAFVTFDQPSTDLDWFRVISEPSWGKRLEANLKPGLHLVTFFATHPVSREHAYCELRIIVKEGEAPKVNDCPNDIIGKNGTFFTWTEPTFTDNVGVTTTSKNENPGKFFSIGEWKVVYEASDEAGWTTRCVFSVMVHQD